MALKLPEPCPHDASDQDVATQADGLCPLCLLARVEDAELALAVWDGGRESEYWLRYPPAGTN